MRLPLPSSWAGSPSLLQIGLDPPHRPRPRFPPAAQIEDKSGITHGITPKTGGADVLVIERVFNVSKQIHWTSPPFRLGRTDFPIEFLRV